MADSIRAPNPLSFPDSRPQKREKERHNDFTRWLAGGGTANSNDTAAPAETAPAYSVPLMSVEGILLLAQAHEEDFAGHMKVYSDAAKKIEAEDDEQYSFDFIPQDDHPGEIMNEQI